MGSPLWQRNILRHQNSIRMANCIWRMVAPGAKPVIRPLSPQSTHPTGWPRLTLLKRLKTSHRNCPRKVSVKFRFLNIEKSVLK